MQQSPLPPERQWQRQFKLLQQITFPELAILHCPTLMSGAILFSAQPLQTNLFEIKNKQSRRCKIQISPLPSPS
jgi:hypothetical protein